MFGPFQEEVEWEHRSNVAGKMHACGHDAHTAMLLGAARILHEHRNNLQVTVPPSCCLTTMNKLYCARVTMDQSARFSSCQPPDFETINQLAFDPAAQQTSHDRFVHARPYSETVRASPSVRPPGV